MKQKPGHVRPRPKQRPCVSPSTAAPSHPLLPDTLTVHSIGGVSWEYAGSKAFFAFDITGVTSPPMTKTLSSLAMGFEDSKRG